MVLPELRAVASDLGIKGISGMRKGDLIAAITDRAAVNTSAGAAPSRRRDDSAAAQGADAPRETPTVDSAAGGNSATEQGGAPTESADAKAADTKPADAKPADADNSAADDAAGSDGGRNDSGAEGNQGGGDRQRQRRRGNSGEGGGQNNDRQNNERQGGDRQNNDRQNNDRQNNDRQNNDRKSGDGGSNAGGSGKGNQQGGNQQGGGNRNQGPDDGDGEGRGRRGRRFRERRRGRDRDGGEPQISEDDVLQPVAGILDVLDNYAFVRTSGYLAGPNDVYVSMNLIRKNGLRRGDAVTGAVRVPKDGESQGNQRQKFNPLVRLDTVNGSDVESAKKRPEFSKLTPLYPNQRLRLETTPERLTTRVIDLIMPIGKGQRALIQSPPKAGKTTIMQDIANAISVNNPECYLMVVLVDERPEEVTDMQRSVKGEVIASTFDRPPSDHTSVAELAIERAKRLVEQGKDVVVLLDSITRLGRAYNNASPASGRILSGGVDSTALYPPKRFLGAARNIENGGSLTIIATAMVETGSQGDTVIFEEFKGTGNAELKLDRKIAERRVFPAVDVTPSGTRKDELLMSPEEFAIVHKLRRVLTGLDSQQAIDLLISQLKKTRNNIEFLMQVQKNTPGTAAED
jgi:transcription termination factor Rho